jgi:hypothetical protein
MFKTDTDVSQASVLRKCPKFPDGIAPGSVRDRALYYGSSVMWRVWGGLLHSVQTGESACRHVHGVSFYEHLLRHPEVGDPFNRYMAKTSERHTEAMIRAL